MNYFKQLWKETKQVVKTIADWFEPTKELKDNNTILPDNKGNGMTFDQGKAKAKLGYKVRWIEWNSDHYFYFDGKYFMEHDGMSLVQNDRRLIQSSARTYIGCAWMTCGKIYLTTKAE